MKSSLRVKQINFLMKFGGDNFLISRSSVQNFIKKSKSEAGVVNIYTYIHFWPLKL